MKRAPLCAAVLAVALLAPGTAHASELTGRLLVTMTPTASDRAQTSALRTAGTREVETIPRFDTVVVKPDASTALRAAASVLRARPGVEHVDLERRAEPRFVPNDPALTGAEGAEGTPAGTPVQWWPGKSNLFTAWDIERGDTARVAVIDTGVDATHPELAGKIVSSASFDASGPGTSDAVGHGTHVASLACGAGNDGVSIVGAGLNCKIIAIRSDLSDASVTQSIIAATNMGAHAINMSFGTDGSEAPPQVLRDAIDYAVQHGVVLVAAAADAQTVEQGDPANILQPTNTGPDLANGAIRGLSITSSNFQGGRSSFAGSGSQISMAAYGSFNDGPGGPPGLLGAFPAGRTALEVPMVLGGQGPCGCRASFANDNRYAYLQGTSMSSPEVAGVAALMRVANPSLSALEIVRILKQQALRPAGAGWNGDTGWGVLNGGNALAAAIAIDRGAPASKLRGPKTVKKARSATLRWTGSDLPLAKSRPSGVARYEVYRSAGKSKKFRRIFTTTATRKKLRVKAGQTYRFYTLAIDKAGNREAAPAKPDLTMKVAKKRKRR